MLQEKLHQRHSGNLAVVKANKVSQKPEKFVLGADSVIDLDGELISNPQVEKKQLTF